MRATRKNDHPWLPMTPTFYVKILSYYQKRDVYKKTRQKNIHFWTNGKQFCMINIFFVEPQNFLNISYLAQFSKFLSEFWHVISNYTYQQVINSNMGSNMAPLMVSRGGLWGPPPVGATESDRVKSMYKARNKSGNLPFIPRQGFPLLLYEEQC